MVANRVGTSIQILRQWLPEIEFRTLSLSASDNTDSGLNHRQDRICPLGGVVD